VIDDEDLRKKLIKSYGDHFITSKGLRNKLFILCSRVWVTSTMETPLGGVFLSCRRFVYHLSHGIPVKKAGDAEEGVRWYKKAYYHLVETNFSAFLAPTPDAKIRYQKVYGCSDSKMVLNPQPRMSVMFAEQPKEKKSFKVLYAPTWRNVDAVKLFPFAEYNEETLARALDELNVDIYLHPHPIRQSVDFSGVKSSRLKVTFDKPGEDVNLYLSHYDLLVTDYSSIFVEFLALDRPVMFVPYDYKKFKDRIGMFDYDGDLSTGPKVYSQEEFIKEIRNFVEGKDEYIAQRRALSLKLNGSQVKEACETNYKYIVKQLG
jgi:CDP-glycerol glycerophosphotransferase